MPLGLEPSRIILEAKRISRKYIEQGFVPRTYIETHGFAWVPVGELWEYDIQRDDVREETNDQK
jgi:hypothetical protein